MGGGRGGSNKGDAEDSITQNHSVPVTPGDTHTHTPGVCCPWLCCRHLPNGLLPGPLLYIAAGSADLFVTTTAALELEAYKYSNLVAAAGDKQEPGGCFVCVDGGREVQWYAHCVACTPAQRGTVFDAPRSASPCCAPPQHVCHVNQ